MRAADLGAVTRVDISHDDTGRAASWHLNRVLVTQAQQQAVCFPCGRWLSRVRIVARTGAARRAWALRTRTRMLHQQTACTWSLGIVGTPTQGSYRHRVGV